MKSVESRLYEIADPHWIIRNLKGNQRYGIGDDAMRKAQICTDFLLKEAGRIQFLIQDEDDKKRLHFVLHHLSECNDPWTDVAYHLFKAADVLDEILVKINNWAE